MLVALIGAHGTGKTTTANALCNRMRPGWSLFQEYYRRIATQLGYTCPREAVLEEEQATHITATALCASSLAAELEWCLQIKTGHGVIDMGPVSVLAYNRYWMARCEEPASPYLTRLCSKISDMVDYYVYLPVGAIPLVADGMRSTDSDFQLAIDVWVSTLVKELHIPDRKILSVQSVDLYGRLNEIVNFIEGRGNRTVKNRQSSRFPNNR